MRRPSLITVAAALLVGVGLSLFYWPRLPDVVAAHFDLAGSPDGSMRKGSFLALFGLASVVAVAVPLGLGLCASRLPDALVNLPHKEHWLAPEQRAETLAYLAQLCLRIAAGTAVLLVVCLALTLRANVASEVEMRGSAVLFALGFWLGWLGALMLGLVRRFRKPRPATA